MNVVAVGIGPGVDLDTLQLIAGDGNPVVQVEDFSKLEEMLGTIKSSACSGKMTAERRSQITVTLCKFCPF